MKIVNNKDIDYQKWDNLILHAPQGNIYATSWYLDIVSPGWKAFVNEEYTMGMPIPVSKKWGILSLVRQPYFCQQLGLFSLIEAPQHQFRKNIQVLKKKFFQIIFSGNVNNIQEDESIKEIKRVELRPTHLLSLKAPYEQLLEGYNQNRKRDLNKALKNNLQIHESEDVESLLAIYFEEKKIKETSHFQTLVSLFRAAKERGHARLIYAVHPETGIHSGGLFWEFKEQLIYIFGATTALGKNTGANTFVFNSVIRERSASNKVLDFEGSSVEGIAAFYKSFGAKRCDYPVIKYNFI